MFVINIFLKTQFIIIAIKKLLRYQTELVLMEVFMSSKLEKKSNFIPMGGVSDFSNFGLMGGFENRGVSITSPSGGAIGRTGNDWN